MFSAYGGTTTGSELYEFDGFNVNLVQDLNPGSSSGIDGNTGGLEYNGRYYYSGNDGTTGNELYVYNDTVISLVADIRAGTAGSSPRAFTEYNGILYFSAQHTTNGRELWSYDGNNVVLVADIRPGSSSGNPNNLTVYKGKLYFSANNGSTGTELYSYDGNTVSLVQNINPGSASSSPQMITEYNGDLYFWALTSTTGFELHRFNGSTVSLVADYNPGTTSSRGVATNMIVYNNKLYFSGNEPGKGVELLQYDSTGISLAVEIDTTVLNGSPQNGSPSWFATHQGNLYFRGRTQSEGVELYRWDGTILELVNGAIPGANERGPSFLIEVNNVLYFLGNDNNVGLELLRLGFNNPYANCPTYDFDWQPYTTCPGDTVDFSPKNPLFGATVTWDFAGLGSTTDTIGRFAFPAPGQYAVTLTVNKQGCPAASFTDTIYIDGITISAGITHPSTVGGTDGQIDLVAGGGTPPYSYNWSTGATTEDITNIGAGTYTVTVTDANGCSSTSTLTLNDPLTLNGCLEETFTFIPVDTNSAYTYSWNFGDGNTSSSMITTHQYASTGTYSISLTVLDTSGCTNTAFYALNVGQLIVDSIAAFDALCLGDSSGSAIAYVSGNTGPLTYLWSNGDTTDTAFGLGAGIYTVLITDSLGCTVTDSVTIGEPATAVSASATGTNAGCSAGLDGTATVIATGGTPGYSYSWSTGDSTQTAIGLSAGTYQVIVTDNNGCTDTTLVTISEATPLVITLVGQEPCSNDNSGTITTTVSGGNGPYTYIWNTGATTANLNGLSQGTYSVQVTDANGCTKIVGITLGGQTTPNANFSIQR